MMNVLVYVPGFDIGGIETYLLHLLKKMSDNKQIKITLLTRNAVRTSPVYKQLKRVNIDIISLDIVHLNIKSMSKFICELDNVLSKETYDILHIHEYNEPCVITRAIKHGVKKIILHVHVTNPTESKNKIGISFVKMLVRNKNIKKADIIMAPSRDIFNHYRKKYKNKTTIVTRNCIDTKAYAFNDKKRNAIRTKLNIANNVLVVGHVGRFSEVKNHKFLVNIFDELRKNVDAKLVLIGDGPLRREVELQVAELDLKESVLFLGKRSDINELINIFDLFIFPSFFEGLPISLIEVQCNGIPCLISDTISEEAIVTDLVLKLSLKKPANIWGEYASLHKAKKSRDSYSDIVRQRGYGMDSISKIIEKVYLEESR